MIGYDWLGPDFCIPIITIAFLVLSFWFPVLVSTFLVFASQHIPSGLLQVSVFDI